MEAESHSAPVGPGWRELLELMHSEIEDMRSALTASAEREAALLRLLEAEHNLNREARLIQLLEDARAEVALLRPPPRPIAPLDRYPGPAPTPPARPPSALHGRILEVLEAAQGALTCQRIEALVASPRPLRKVLDGMARRGRIQRVGPGRFAVMAEAVLVGAVGLNGTGA